MFGRRKKNEELQSLESRLARLEGMLELMLTRNMQVEKEEEPASSKKSELEKMKSRMDKIRWALLEKRLKSLERVVSETPQPALVEAGSVDMDLGNPGNPGELDVDKLLSNPVLRMAINSFLKNYGTSIEDIRENPDKIVEILSDILQRVQKKKAEQEKEGKKFDPFDPWLFMRKGD